MLIIHSAAVSCQDAHADQQSQHSLLFCVDIGRSLFRSHITHWQVFKPRH